MTQPTSEQLEQAALRAEAVKCEASNIASMLSNATSYSVCKTFLQRDMADFLKAVNELKKMIKALDEEQQHE